MVGEWPQGVGASGCPGGNKPKPRLLPGPRGCKACKIIRVRGAADPNYLHKKPKVGVATQRGSMEFGSVPTRP